MSRTLSLLIFTCLLISYYTFSDYQRYEDKYTIIKGSIEDFYFVDTFYPEIMVNGMSYNVAKNKWQGLDVNYHINKIIEPYMGIQRSIQSDTIIGFDQTAWTDLMEKELEYRKQVKIDTLLKSRKGPMDISVEIKNILRPKYLFKVNDNYFELSSLSLKNEGYQYEKTFENPYQSVEKEDFQYYVNSVNKCLEKRQYETLELTVNESSLETAERNFALALSPYKINSTDEGVIYKQAYQFSCWFESFFPQLVVSILLIGIIVSYIKNGI